MRAQRISRNGAQIVDLHNRGLCPDKGLARAVRLGCKLPTSATGRAGTGSRPNAEQILGSGGLEDGGGEESAGDGVGVAVSGTIAIASAVSEEMGQQARLIYGQASLSIFVKPLSSKIGTTGIIEGLFH